MSRHSVGNAAAPGVGAGTGTRRPPKINLAGYTPIRLCATPSRDIQLSGMPSGANCRDWVLSSGADVFGTVPGKVAAGVVADLLRRGQIQVDVAVYAPDEPGHPRRVMSPGEAMWDKAMNAGQLEQLRRARDLLVVKGYDTTQTRFTCYSGAGLDFELADRAACDPLIRLVGMEELYG